MANAFFVRCDCRNRRFTGGKSRFLQEADGRKGIASAADELCGSALSLHQLLQRLHQLVDGFIMPGADVVRHAGADMAGKQLLGERVEGGGRRGDLRENIRAVRAVLHHAADAAHLRFRRLMRAFISSGVRSLCLWQASH